MQYDELGKYIREKRVKAGYTLNNFALKNDLEPAMLSRIETLKQGIKLDALLKIAKGFDMTLVEFLVEFEKVSNNN